MPLDLNDPEVAAAIKAAADAAVEASTKGLKSKNDELLAEKKALADTLASFGDIKPDQLRSYADRLKNDEEARLISEGKVTEVIDRRTEAMRAAYQAKLEDAANAQAKIEAEKDAIKSQFIQMSRDTAIRAAASAAAAVPTAIDDIVIRASSVFSLTEDGRLVAIDPATKDIRLGPDGRVPYSPADFMNDLKTKAPHFWPPSVSGGFAGGTGNSLEGLDRAKAALHGTGGFAAYKALKAKQKG